MPLAIRAAPAALMTLIGVVGLVLQMPVRPYFDGQWVPSDLLGLLIIGLVVGVLNRSVSGLVGTIVGATAAVAIQLYVLTESASYTPTVVASLGEPPWSGQVLLALAVGIASLSGGYLAGAGAGRLLALLRTREKTMRSPGLSIRDGLIPSATLAAAAVLTVALVRAAATSAYVPSESQLIRVSVQGDRILAVVPDTVPAGRVVIDTVWSELVAGAGVIGLNGPITDELDTPPQTSYWPAYGFSPLLPTGDDLVHGIARMDLGPGRYSVVVLEAWEPPSDVGLDVPLPALDARTITVTGPEPATFRAATGGPVVNLGRLFGIGVVGWGVAGSLLGARRRNVALAATVAVVAAGIMWVLVDLSVVLSWASF